MLFTLFSFISITSFYETFLDFELEDIFTNTYLIKFSFSAFLRMSAKGHVILALWSDYSSPVTTQHSDGIGNLGLTCGHCLECCNLCYFSNWRQDFSVMRAGVVVV